MSKEKEISITILLPSPLNYRRGAYVAMSDTILSIKQYVEKNDSVPACFDEQRLVYKQPDGKLRPLHNNHTVAECGLPNRAELVLTMEYRRDRCRYFKLYPYLIIGNSVFYLDGLNLSIQDRLAHATERVRHFFEKKQAAKHAHNSDPTTGLMVYFECVETEQRGICKPEQVTNQYFFPHGVSAHVNIRALLYTVSHGQDLQSLAEQLLATHKDKPCVFEASTDDFQTVLSEAVMDKTLLGSLQPTEKNTFIRIQLRLLRK